VAVTLRQLVALRLPAKPVMRRPARIARAPQPPRAPELKYVRALQRLTRRIHAVVRAQIFPHLDEIIGIRKDVLHGSIWNRFQLVTEDVHGIVDEDEITPVIKSTGAAVDAFNKREMVRSIGIPLRSVNGLGDVMDRFRRQNVELITSIAVDELDRVERLLDEAQAGAMRVETLRDNLVEQFGIVDSRAALIARDQVLKLNGQLTQTRQENAGVVEYIWTTSHDERVRPGHAHLDGTRHAWLAAPVVDERTGRRAHPGQDFQCRCTPTPVIPELE
jgi:SPP1 gp7 family putative phage head morphogenesis protein